MRSEGLNKRSRRSTNRDKKSRTIVPLLCPINFDFSSTRIECKTCKHFNGCLRIYIKAEKLAKEI